jgi:hypothetical protein
MDNKLSNVDLEINSVTLLTLRSNNDYHQLFFHGATAPTGPGPPYYRGFTITLRHTTLGRTPLDEWSARRRDLYLTTHNTQKRQTSMPPAGFEPAIPASERPQTHALDSAVTGIGWFKFRNNKCHGDDNTFVSGLCSVTEPDTSLPLLAPRSVHAPWKVEQ